MIIFLIASVVLLVVAYFLLDVCNDAISNYVAPITIVIGIAGVITAGICGLNFQSAATEAKLLNTRYGTQYTQEEAYYGKSVIYSIHQIHQNTPTPAEE